jgi:hypothetical protein
MKKITAFIICLFLISCSKNISNENELSLFFGNAETSQGHVLRENKLIFVINDSLIYNGRITPSSTENVLFAKINKLDFDSVVKFIVVINDRDTSYFCNINNIDSLVFNVFESFRIYDQNFCGAWEGFD